MKKIDLTGKGIGVAILDTGIYPHEDLKHHICSFQDFVNNKKVPYDDNGHGTHVAGIIGGDGTASKGKICGLAPECSLVALKILDKEGNGKKEFIIKAMDWIEKNKDLFNIKVVNISVGTTTQGDNTALISAVEHIWDIGVTVVAAAGNRGPGKYSITAPGSSKKIITVGASDMIMKNHRISGRGPTREGISKPDIVAPGHEIISCNNHPEKGGYTVKSGTSMATPVVTGGIALLLEKYPYLTNIDVKRKLKQSAMDLGYSHNLQGWGLFQLQKFLS